MSHTTVVELYILPSPYRQQHMPMSRDSRC